MNPDACMYAIRKTTKQPGTRGGDGIECNGINRGKTDRTGLLGKPGSREEGRARAWGDEVKMKAGMKGI